jgi:hypothetical protein
LILRIISEEHVGAATLAVRGMERGAEVRSYALVTVFVPCVIGMFVLRMMAARAGFGERHAP